MEETRPGSFDNDVTAPDARSWWSTESHRRVAWVSTVAAFQPHDFANPQNSEQAKWLRCRARVAESTASILPSIQTIGNVAHKSLYHGIELLSFVPIPGLAPAAHILLAIWEGVQQVDMNRHALLRLTERCATILLDVRMELRQAGDEVTNELREPICRLMSTFEKVHEVVQKQSSRPFLMRFLKRDDILEEIQDCHRLLSDAMKLFGNSLHLRMYSRLFFIDRHLRSQIGPEPDSRAFDDVDIATIYSVDQEVILPSEVETTEENIELVDASRRTSMKSTEEVLHGVFTKQDEEDREFDISDLRRLLQTAVNTSSDLEMLTLLQIEKREDIPEAFKTLQRALEKVLESQHMNSARSSVSSTFAGQDLEVHTKSLHSQTLEDDTASIVSSCSETDQSWRTAPSRRRIRWSGETEEVDVRYRDTLEQEFIESGLDALRRITRKSISLENEDDVQASDELEFGSEGARRHSSGSAMEHLPSWTITKYEIDRDEQIGRGLCSDVYRATWKGKVVALKILAEKTPHNLFTREVEIWKELSHPHILELFGASSTAGEPPWFFVSPYLQHGSLSDFLRSLQGRAEFFEALQIPLSRTRSLDPPKGAGRLQSRAFKPSFNNGTLALSDPWSASQADQSEPNHVKNRRRSKSDVPLPSRDPRTGEEDAQAGSSSRPQPATPMTQDHVQRASDLLRYMYEISSGMTYLHEKGVLHGDLKASNVLVDDSFQCVISDFGQSGLRTEISRLSGAGPPRGTLRWQSPSLMKGSPLTASDDVYAFAMTSLEILGLGKGFWSSYDDSAIRNFILCEGKRPPIPRSRRNSPALDMVIQQAWAQDPSARPHFSHIQVQIMNIRAESPGPTLLAVPGLSVDDCGSSTAPSESITSTAPPRSDTSATSFYDSDFIPAEEILTEKDRLSKAQDEMTYRIHLNRDSFHPSLSLPLWSPSFVPLGVVGYLKKPEGFFLPLMDAFKPRKSRNSRIQELPSIHGYGQVKITQKKTYRSSRRDRMKHSLSGMLAFPKGDSPPVSDRITFPLRAEMKHAYLGVDKTNYRFFENTEAAERWFKAHADVVLDAFAQEHDIIKEDLMMVVGALDAQKWALFVSHSHPDGNAHLDIFSNPKKGGAWGSFHTDNVVTDGPPRHGAQEIQTRFNSKVGFYRGGDHYDTLLLARLRFHPDKSNPILL